MQWSFSNKGSSAPQFLSFNSSEEEKPKTGFEALASTGLVTITTTETVDSGMNPYSSIMQVSCGLFLHIHGLIFDLITIFLFSFFLSFLP